MIHHLSISANHPLHVAQVIAELWQGEAIPFPFHPGSYVVLTYDPNGTLIEIYPHGTELKPNPQPSVDQSFQFTCNANASAYTATHAAISVPVSLAQIQEIGAREGWWTLHRGRHGFFELVELWIENQFLLELLPPEFAAQYRDFMQPQNLKQVMSDATA